MRAERREQRWPRVDGAKAKEALAGDAARREGTRGKAALEVLAARGSEETKSGNGTLG